MHVIHLIIIMLDLLSTKEGYTPLHLASYHGNLDVVKMLIDNGVFIDDSSEVMQ